MKHVFVERLHVPFVSVGTNIEYIIKEELIEKLEGKCNKDGFIKPDSIRILSISSGEIVSDMVVFHVTIECLLCHPMEGMTIHVKAVNVTKAGIRAISADHEVSPFDVFVARDHNYMSKEFTNIEVGQTFYIDIIGSRFEIFDPTISILGDISKSKKKQLVKRKNLVVEESKYSDDTTDEEREVEEEREDEEEEREDEEEEREDEEEEQDDDEEQEDET